MIFVTVGTHEQQFNRLVEKIDDLRARGMIGEEVIIQTGYCTYQPKHCTWQALYPYDDMIRYVNEARIVITHGGPSSFIMPLQVGKVPIVVPRRKQYDEHVNDHQAQFARAVEARLGNIIVIEDVEQLQQTLERYEEICMEKSSEGFSHNGQFNAKFSQMVEEIM